MLGNVKVKETRRDMLVDEEMRAFTLFNARAYDEENEVFWLGEDALGFAFECTPLVGGDSRVQERIKSLTNMDFPDETIVSYMLFRCPNTQKELAQTMMLRDNVPNETLAKKVVRERVKFMERGSLKPVDEKLGTRFFDLKLIVSVRIPINDAGSIEQSINETVQNLEKVESSLQTASLAPRRLNAKGYLQIMGSIVNGGPNASWRTGPVEYDNGRLLSDQILDYDKDIQVEKNHLRIGDQFIKTLSAKRLPQAVYFGAALNYVGDLRGGGVSVKAHYAICCNILYKNPRKERSNMERKRMWAVNQAKGPLLGLAPTLAEKKRGFDTLYQSLEDGNRTVSVSYSMMIFGDSQKHVEDEATRAKSLWREQRFTMLEDSLVQLPMFLNNLPMNSCATSARDLWRYKTMTAEQAGVLIPIFGEWKGTGTPHLNLVSRNGQMMSFSMHDSGSNKNMLVAATSGGGKSFFTNELIMSYLSEGAKVWVIDVGRSYEKLASAIDGNFMQFGADSDVCTNPFDLVVSMDGSEETRSKMLTEQEKEKMKDPESKDEGEEDALVGIVSSMASMNEELTDFQLMSLRRIVGEVWRQKDRNMTVDDIIEACKNEDDPRIHDIGAQMFAFGSTGSYGKFFRGKNNLDLSREFTVLELEELKSRKHLQKVILFQLIYQIQQEVYLGDRNRKKVVVIDEGWDLIQNGGPEIKGFIEHAYRRFRKYGASVILITQSVQDMFKSDIGEALMENSATQCLFRHKEESVEKLKAENKLVMPDGGFELLKTVHTAPPHYSEIFIQSESGTGVGRLVVDPFSKLLYSTEPNEVQAIDNLKKKGYSIEEAINQILIEKGEAR